MAQNLSCTLSDQDWKYLRRPGNLHGPVSERLMGVLKIPVRQGLPGAIGVNLLSGQCINAFNAMHPRSFTLDRVGVRKADRAGMASSGGWDVLLHMEWDKSSLKLGHRGLGGALLIDLLASQG
jgi:hypothetical protein